jgi:uncharacterized protein
MPEHLLFIDTWAWLALYNPADQFHDIAQVANEELLSESYAWLTTNFVLDGTYTALRRWTSHARAVGFGNTVRAIAESGAVEIVTLTPTVEQTAWKLFTRYDTIPHLTYTDCTSFAVMRERGINLAFTGDEHFRFAGFEIRP